MKNLNILAICGVLVLMISLMISGCASKMESGINELSFEGVYMDYFIYDDINSIIDETPVIVVGKIIKDNIPEKININIGEHREEKPFNLIFTVSELEVDKVIKGGVNVGDVIKIKQMGGSYKEEVLKVDEIEYLKEGQFGVFFLSIYPGWDIPADLKNPYQGFVEIVEGEKRSNGLFDLFKNEMTEEKIIDLLVETVIKKDKLNQ
ncbi:hypothetical protein [Desulfitibacter alkalitolerans]|uniref:hypothetical protein n=1 Tax=Desulfitibacter alkalitolerans TaxID=264641 RepID=UPI00048A2188|nr:hypothetical protein [Desulfitibacter alkalitolerans]